MGAFKRQLQGTSPLLILGFSIFATSFGVLLNHRSQLAFQRASFESLVNDFEVSTENRIQIYLNTLISTQGFMNSSPAVDREHFKQFVSIFNLSEKYPGIQGIGFAEKLSQDSLQKHIKQVRAEGLSDYKVWPRDERQTFFAIKYLEPQDWRNKRALGFDMSSELVRRQAMERARDTGVVAASGKVRLVQETNENIQYGFLLYAPLYKTRGVPSSLEERQKQLIGYAYSPFRIGDLFQEVLNELKDKNELIQVEVFEGHFATPDNLVFQSLNSSPNSHQTNGESGPQDQTQTPWPWLHAKLLRLGLVQDLVGVRPRVVAGTQFILKVRPSPKFIEETESQLTLLFALFGGAISFLVTYVIQVSQESNRSKSNFLANMSHEIRTPLGAVMGYSDLLAVGDLSPKEKDTYIRVIKRNGELLSNIINDILDFSKIEAGKLEVISEVIGLSEIYDDLTKLFEAKASEKKIQLLIQRAPDLPEFITTDGLRLRQILLNLIGNAIKFTEKGTVRMDVQKINTRSEGDQICFDVMDSGCGIAPGTVKNLFQPFTQADETINRKYGGTGLGLVLSRKLAKLLGGNVELISNKLGNGCVFRARIALSIPSEQELKIVNRRSEVQQLATLEGEQRIANKKILVVDDTIDNQLLVSRLLSKVGAKVDLADNGLVAVEKVKRQKFDLILMDLQMPVLSGYEALLEIRKLGIQTPVIAFSAHALVEVRDHCLASGFSDHVSKPIEKRILMERVAHLV